MEYYFIVILRIEEVLPERATISFAVKPFLENTDISSSRFISGEARSVFALLKLALVESLLPN